MLITDIDKDIEESQPLKATVNGAQDNQGVSNTYLIPINHLWPFSQKIVRVKLDVSYDITILLFTKTS